MAEVAEDRQRQRFVQRLTNTKRLFAVRGETDLARLPSPTCAGRDCVMVWTDRNEAARWADCLVSNPSIEEIQLGDVLSNLLPDMAANEQMLAADWTAETVESETEPADIAAMLRAAIVAGFMARAEAAQNIFIHETDKGPCLIAAAQNTPSSDERILPCWTQREVAEARLTEVSAEPGQTARVMRIPLTNFVQMTLPWLVERAYGLSPDHARNETPTVLSPDDFARHCGLAVPGGEDTSKSGTAQSSSIANASTSAKLNTTPRAASNYQGAHPLCLATGSTAA
ncbi:MAG: DUF2750 domain-containing protein [Pseudomonadota bacterium]